MMNPDELSKKGTESGHQKALFNWAAMAVQYGFAISDDMTCYSRDGLQAALAHGRWPKPVKELAWLHSIPNGGAREARTAALMKAEGARAGVADVFLPVPQLKEDRFDGSGAGEKFQVANGLYIEMKKPGGGVLSEEQKAFAEHCRQYGYLYCVCHSWREAATVIRDYLR